MNDIVKVFRTYFRTFFFLLAVVIPSLILSHVSIVLERFSVVTPFIIH